MPSHHLDRPAAPFRHLAAKACIHDGRSNVLRVLIHCDDGPGRALWLKAFSHRGIDVGVEQVDANQRDLVDAVVAVLPDELRALHYCRGRNWARVGTLIVITPAPTATGRKRALMAGADHYFSTGVDPDELVLRVRTHRRRMARLQSASPVFDARLHFGRFTMDVLSNSVRGPDGAEARLSSLSARLLLALLQSPAVPLSLSRLAALTSLESARPSEHHMRVAIHRLRRQLAGLAPTEPAIVNVCGSGYILMEESQGQEQSDRPVPAAVRTAFQPSVILDAPCHGSGTNRGDQVVA